MRLKAQPHKRQPLKKFQAWLAKQLTMLGTSFLFKD